MQQPLVDALLVEDHELVRDALSLALELSGVTLAVATSFGVDDVVTLAENVQPRVVLLDFYLESDADSLPMIGPLVALGSTVLMLTGTTDRRVRERCLAAGAADVIDKSVGFDAIIERVKSLRPPAAAD